MNAERLYSIAQTVSDDYERLNLIRLLQKVEASYSQSIASPSSDTASTFESALSAFKEAAASQESNQMQANKAALLPKIGAADLVGPGLVDRLDYIMSSSASPASTVVGLQTLRSRMEKLRESLATIAANFAALGLEPEHPPEPGSAALSLLLPDSLYNDNLQGLASEATVLNDALLTLEEAATGSRAPLDLRSASTGSLDITITIDPAVVKILLEIAKGFLELAVAALAYRKVKKDLERYKMPEDIGNRIDEVSEKRTAALIQQTTVKMLERISDKVRRDELTNSRKMERAVSQIADRLGRGLMIGVELPEMSESEETHVNEISKSEMQQLRRSVQDLANEIRTLSAGSEPLLKLPAVTDAGDVAGQTNVD